MIRLHPGGVGSEGYLRLLRNKTTPEYLHCFILCVGVQKAFSESSRTPADSTENISIKHRVSSQTFWITLNNTGQFFQQGVSNPKPIRNSEICSKKFRTRFDCKKLHQRNLEKMISKYLYAYTYYCVHCDCTSKQNSRFKTQRNYPPFSSTLISELSVTTKHVNNRIRERSH